MFGSVFATLISVLTRSENRAFSYWATGDAMLPWGPPMFIPPGCGIIPGWDIPGYGIIPDGGIMPG